MKRKQKTDPLIPVSGEVITGGDRSLPKRTKMTLLGGAIVLLALLVFAGWAVYRQANPTVNKVDDPSLLAGYSIDSLKYDSMTDEQRNAQLKRQIGMSVDELKSEKNISESLFRSHEDARKAALALAVSQALDKAEQAYEAAYRKLPATAPHDFFAEYGSFLTGQGEYVRSTEVLKKGLERAKASKVFSDQTKTEIEKSYIAQIKLNESLSTMDQKDL